MAILTVGFKALREQDAGRTLSWQLPSELLSVCDRVIEVLAVQEVSDKLLSVSFDIVPIVTLKVGALGVVLEPSSPTNEIETAGRD